MVSFLFCIVVFYKVSFSFSIFSNESNAANCAACFLVISHMLHFGLFGLQIEDIRFLGGHLDGDAFLN